MSSILVAAEITDVLEIVSIATKTGTVLIAVEAVAAVRKPFSGHGECDMRVDSENVSVVP